MSALGFGCSLQSGTAPIHPPECRDDFALAPGVILWTHRDDIGTDDDPTQQNWIEWMAATFPPDVCQNVVLLPVYRANGR